MCGVTLRRSHLTCVAVDSFPSARGERINVQVSDRARLGEQRKGEKRGGWDFLWVGKTRVPSMTSCENLFSWNALKIADHGWGHAFSYEIERRKLTASSSTLICIFANKWLKKNSNLTFLSAPNFIFYDVHSKIKDWICDKASKWLRPWH